MIKFVKVKYKIPLQEEEQHDRMLISNAENIAARDLSLQSGRNQDYNQVIQRKLLLDQKKFEKFQKSCETKQLKLANIKFIHAQNLASIRQQKVLRDLEMRKHWDLRNDIQRRKCISSKKVLHSKNERMQKNMLRLQENRETKDKAKQTVSWKKRISERIANEEKTQSLLREVERQKRAFIKTHIAAYKEKWLKIEEEIKERASRNRSLFKSCKKQNQEKPRNIPSPNCKERLSLCTEFQSCLENLLDEEVCTALNTALDMEDNVKVPFNADDPIYKAAQFIMQHILTECHKDLTCDQVAYSSVYRRVGVFFEEVKKFVIFVSAPCLIMLSFKCKR